MPKRGEEIVDIDIQLIRETAAAWLVKSLTTNKEAWIPFSIGEIEITSRSAPSHSPAGWRMKKDLPDVNKRKSRTIRLLWQPQVG